MILNYRKFGDGHPLIILHGLYGQGDNWLTIGKNFSGFCEVFLLDQRNHGLSPHDSQHDYEVLMADLKDFMDQHGIEKAMILGHSMGGKVAMRFAMEYPGMVSKLIIADISPASYLDEGSNNHVDLHMNVIGAMLKVDLNNSKSLSDIDIQLAKNLNDERLRKFLLKNIKKQEGGGYSWKLNLKVLLDNLKAISDGLDIDQLNNTEIKNFAILFLRGENSTYIGDKDRDLIKSIFPLSQLVTLKNAGHWLHAEQPELFAKIVKRFILS